MNRIVLTVAVYAVAMASLAGCSKPEAAGEGEPQIASPRLAIVDLDKVANDLGWMKDVQQNMTTLKTQFQNDLKNAKEAYTSQIMAKKTEYAPKDSDKLTPQQQQILSQMVGMGNQSFAQLNQVANQQLQQYLQQWIAEYRQAIGPTVRQVAEEKKMWMVLEKGGVVLYSMPSTEITDAVVDAARSHPPVLHPIQAPTLPNPGTITVNAATQPTTAPATTATSPDVH